MLRRMLLLGCADVVELHPLHTRAGAHLDRALRRLDRRTRQSRQQRLHQQREHQKASQVPATDEVDGHRRAGYHGWSEDDRARLPQLKHLGAIPMLNTYIFRVAIKHFDRWAH